MPLSAYSDVQPLAAHFYNVLNFYLLGVVMAELTQSQLGFLAHISAWGSCEQVLASPTRYIHTAEGRAAVGLPHYSAASPAYSAALLP